MTGYVVVMVASFEIADSLDMVGPLSGQMPTSLIGICGNLEGGHGLTPTFSAKLSGRMSHQCRRTPATPAIIEPVREAFRLSIWTMATLLGVGLLAALLIGVPRALSDDACLRDADIDCTTASSFLQGLDVAGSLAGLLATRVLVVILAIAVASEATQYGSDRRRKRRATKAASARRVGEEPSP